MNTNIFSAQSKSISEHIYRSLFTTYLNKIKNLEVKYLEAIANKTDTKTIKLNIISELNNYNNLFTQYESFTNILIPTDEKKMPNEQNEQNEQNKKKDRKDRIERNNSINQHFTNQFVIFIDNLETNWIICDLISKLINAGGNLSNAPKEYIDKYEYIKYLNEFDKGFNIIDEKIINEKIDEYYDLFNLEQKKRYHTYKIYLLVEKQTITEEDLDKINKYYHMGLDLNLLDDLKNKTMFNLLDKYYMDKKIDTITPDDLLQYKNIISDDKNLATNIKKHKIQEYAKKYYTNELDKLLLFEHDYKKNYTEIRNCIKKLEQINVVLTQEQAKKINKMNKQEIDKYTHTFTPNSWFPLFTPDELNCLKIELFSDKKSVCDIVKKIFPYYKISLDYFCLATNPKTNQLIYTNQEDIKKTINAYCIIMILIGLINERLSHTHQDYIIMLKGGKALQLLLSKIYNGNDIDYESNDIDLIVCPYFGLKYDESKCANFAMNIAHLIKWIFNTNSNLYMPINYITSIQGTEYKTLIKISHKIQKSESEYESSAHTAIVDIDYGKINREIYRNVIFERKKCIFGKLLYLHQNYDDFLFEKLYYFDYYIKEFNKIFNKSKIPNVLMQYDDYKNFNNYQRFIEKFKKQIYYTIKIKLKKIENVNQIKTFLINFLRKNNIKTNINIDNVSLYLI
jgi:hypothetical protein